MSNTGIQISALPVAQALSGQEFVPVVALGHISGVTQAVNAVVTINDTTPVNPFVPGETVALQAIAGMTQLNGQGCNVVAVGGTAGAWTITIPIDTTAYAAYVAGGYITATVQVPLRTLLLAAGLYNPTFQSGNIQYTGVGGQLAGDNNLIFGLLIPNPGGVPGPFLLLGSGLNVSFWIGQDQAFTTAQHGNDLGITTGEVQPGSTQRGGNTWKIGGAADLGTGGTDTDQGGTSARGPGGLKIVQGGNNTDGLHPPGDVFMIAGESGSQGATAHWIATVLNGIAGVLRHRFNSTILIDEFVDGSWFWYAVNGGTYGDAGAPIMSRGGGQPMGPAIVNTDVVDHVEVINGKTFTWVKGLLKSVV